MAKDQTNHVTMDERSWQNNVSPLSFVIVAAAALFKSSRYVSSSLYLSVSLSLVPWPLVRCFSSLCVVVAGYQCGHNARNHYVRIVVAAGRERRGQMQSPAKVKKAEVAQRAAISVHQLAASNYQKFALETCINIYIYIYTYKHIEMCAFLCVFVSWTPDINIIMIMKRQPRFVLSTRCLSLPPPSSIQTQCVGTTTTTPTAATRH